MLGEYSFEYIVLAWQVSIIKKISLYLPARVRAMMTDPCKRAQAPLLLPHLLDSIGQIECADLLVVLELEELVPAVPSHL